MVKVRLVATYIWGDDEHDFANEYGSGYSASASASRAYLCGSDATRIGGYSACAYEEAAQYSDGGRGHRWSFIRKERES